MPNRRFYLRIFVFTGVALLSVIALPILARAGEIGRSDPLVGDGVHPVIFYYDYSDDGVTTDQIIHDKTNNTTDTIPLLNPDSYYSFLGNPPIRDDLATALVDGSSRLNETGAEPGLPFQFESDDGLDFLLPEARVFDVDATGNAGITVTKNLLGHQNISDAGGFTFESYVRRTTDMTGTTKQHIWSPEDSHSVEISSTGQLQIVLRGLTAPLVVPVETALPLGEWHHLMAVLDVVQPIPPGGDPEVSSLIVNYSLFIDGQLLGTTPDVDLISGSCCILEFLDREHVVGGSAYGEEDERFRGQMALTRLSLGTLSLEQSLFFTGNDGDYNRDGAVDVADYVMWRKLSGATVAQGTFADGNGDGTIDQDDYNHWRNRIGNMPGSGAGAEAASGVPEPSVTAMFLMGCVPLVPALTIRRR